MGGALFACPTCGKRLASAPPRCPYCRSAIAAPAEPGSPAAGAVEFFASLPAPSVTGRDPRPGESIFDEASVGGEQPTERLTPPPPPFELPPPLARPAAPPHRPASPPLPPWVAPALVGLGAYALLATALAAWGWLRR